MTRLFREVDIVDGECVEPLDYVGERVPCCPAISGRWHILYPSKFPEVGFVEVDYTTEDVDKLRQRVQELETLIESLRVSRAVLVD